MDEEHIRRRGVSLTARGRLSARMSGSVELSEMGRSSNRWKRYYSEEHGREYFKNVDTNDTSWELPNGASVEGSSDAQRSRWWKRYSVEHGREYFENVESRDVTWVLPENATAMDYSDGRFAVENPIMSS